MLVLLLACGGEPAAKPEARPAAPPAAATPAKPDAHASAPAGGPDKAFPCCDTPAAKAVVDAFVQLDGVLAADDAAGVGPALEGLKAATATELPAVSSGLGALAGKPIAEVRTGLKPLAKELVAYARKHQGGDGKVAEAYCPMADANWLQTGATIANPYYGAEMLTCGTFQ